MKKVISVLLIITAVCALFCGCAGNKNTPAVSMYDLSKAMLEATEFQEMSYASSSDDKPDALLANVSDIDYGKVEAFFISYASVGKGNADEIVVIALKDVNDVQEAENSLRAHLTKRQSTYATYDPTQSEKVGKGIVFSEGRYSVLIVSGDNTAVKTAFSDFIKQG